MVKTDIPEPAVHLGSHKCPVSVSIPGGALAQRLETMHPNKRLEVPGQEGSR